MDCQREKTKSQCTCTYEPCSRKGICCECIAYHRQNGEAPGCLFPADVERTFDRSLGRLADCYRR